ncbi:MAG: DUF6017 domain-containing protein [Lactimicrobium massiliense]|nr:DUF6017 domain-containing protein [Lactimicrobium massiliense]MDY3931179.1 DUF6017 domain-containing protein [Erysipelotrichaceae bacterium]MDD6229332.1 DUF6017 domain-containing protein [Lactimicrobium massiliense]MDD6458195.1 DUF6017 domain-containing protein [Lactimicrobium massiliense]MDD6561175.1 DUF6017 domain-containing protein [Lactimicrobium massiliense]MDD6675122.1 DUF6017 domain-containing protein [Lactimicrobium massiliense]
MQFDYFTGRQTEQFAFYQIPKILIMDERFEQLSLDAKLLYSIMLDRAALSSKNGWLDDKGRVYIIYTLEQVMADLHCANQKVSRMMKELVKIGLIERKRQGQGKPTLIYVKDFTTGLDEEQPKSSQVQNHENHESEADDPEKDGVSQVLNHENHESDVVNIMSPESWKSHTNNTDNNKTENNETESINQSAFPTHHSLEESKRSEPDGYDVMRNRIQLESYLKNKLYYDDLLMKYPYDHGRIDEIFGVLVEVLTSKAKAFRIAGEDMPAKVVKSRFMKLEYSHIEYILECFRVQVTDIRNIKQYLLTTIYNAPLTIDHYYTAKAHYVMANWKEGEEL